MRLGEGLVLALVAGSAAAAAAAWRAARTAGRAAEANARRAEALGAAVRKAVHDLNNPLAAAAINAELLMQINAEDPNAQRLAKSIQDQIDRAKEAAAALSQLTHSPS